MKLFRLKKYINLIRNKLLKIKTKFNAKKIIIPPVRLTRKQLHEREKFYDSLVFKILEDINLYKDIKVDWSASKQKLEGYRIQHSLADLMGSVIFKREEIYRGVKPQSVDYAIELFESGLLQILAKNGLIPETEITNYYTDDFPLILKHKKVDMIYPQFWSFSMLKDVIINMLLIDEIAQKFGYCLVDGHPYNSTIFNGKPVFIDIGSFVKFSNRSSFTNEIMFYMMNLVMKSLMNSFFGNRFFASLKGGTTLPGCSFEKSLEYETYINNFSKTHSKSSLIYKRIINKIFNKKHIKPAYIDLLFNLDSRKTAWHDYSYERIKNLEHLKNTNNRYTRILELLDEFSPDAESSLDLAGSSGVMSYLISQAKSYKSIVSTDYDELAVDYGYKIFQNINIKHCVLNFISFASGDIAYNLFIADVVLALAITHHLILTQKNDISTMFSRIKKYCNKYIYIEFCPLGMYSSGMNYYPDIPQWYTEDWFEENFKNYFELLHKETLATVMIGNKEEKHRIIFVGKII